LRNGAAQRGRPPEGADGGDARTESSAEEGLRWWKTGEVNAWVMGSVCGTRVWTDEANSTRGKKKVGRRPVAPFNGSGGEGPEGWALHGGRAGEKEREGGLGAV
jgi:hypothetical protein